jgi:hypothetical protein
VVKQVSFDGLSKMAGEAHISSSDADE